MCICCGLGYYFARKCQGDGISEHSEHSEEIVEEVVVEEKIVEEVHHDQPAYGQQPVYPGQMQPGYPMAQPGMAPMQPMQPGYNQTMGQPMM